MTAPADRPLDVLVIGGGQAGLAMGYQLAQRGQRFLIVDGGAEIGAAWRSRWDSLVLFTPAQYDNLPGLPFPAAPDTYPGKDDVANYLQDYAAAFDLPVRLNTTVTSLSKSDGGYVAHAGDDMFEARQVVVATGPFHVPFVPPIAAQLDPDVYQVHSAGLPKPRAPSPGPGAGGRRRKLRLPDRAGAVRHATRSSSPPEHGSRRSRSGRSVATCGGGPAERGWTGSPSIPDSGGGWPDATNGSESARGAWPDTTTCGSGRGSPRPPAGPSPSPTAPPPSSTP